MDDYRRHGGPFDRGSADFYYGRPYNPHYFEGGTHSSPCVYTLTDEELQAYDFGWDEAESRGDRKDWG